MDAAFKCAIEAWTHPHQPSSAKLFRQASREARRAIQAGCSDPFVLYIKTRLAETQNCGLPEDYRNVYPQIAEAMRGSAYPVWRKAYVCCLAAASWSGKITSPADEKTWERRRPGGSYVFVPAGRRRSQEMLCATSFSFISSNNDWIK